MVDTSKSDSIFHFCYFQKAGPRVTKSVPNPPNWNKKPDISGYNRGAMQNSYTHIPKHHSILYKHDKSPDISIFILGWGHFFILGIICI